MRTKLLKEFRRKFEFHFEKENDRFVVVNKETSRERGFLCARMAARYMKRNYKSK